MFSLPNHIQDIIYDYSGFKQDIISHFKNLIAPKIDITLKLSNNCVYCYLETVRRNRIEISYTCDMCSILSDNGIFREDTDYLNIFQIKKSWKSAHCYFYRQINENMLYRIILNSDYSGLLFINAITNSYYYSNNIKLEINKEIEIYYYKKQVLLNSIKL